MTFPARWATCAREGEHGISDFRSESGQGRIRLSKIARVRGGSGYHEPMGKRTHPCGSCQGKSWYILGFRAWCFVAGDEGAGAAPVGRGFATLRVVRMGASEKIFLKKSSDTEGSGGGYLRRMM